MKYFLFLLSLILVGCGSDTNTTRMSATDLSPIGGKVGEARDAIKEKKYDVADKKLIEAQKILVDKQHEVEEANSRANKMAERLNYLEPKYSAAVGILWKWRLIAAGSWALLIGWFVLRQYFPFLKIL